MEMLLLLVFPTQKDWKSHERQFEIPRANWSRDACLMFHHFMPVQHTRVLVVPASELGECTERVRHMQVYVGVSVCTYMSECLFVHVNTCKQDSRYLHQAIHLESWVMVDVNDQALDQTCRPGEGLALACSMKIGPICRLETSSFRPQSFLPRRKPLWELGTQSPYGAKGVVDVRGGHLVQGFAGTLKCRSLIHHLGAQCTVRACKVHVYRYQQSCFGLSLLERLPSPSSNYPGNQQLKPAQTQNWHLEWHTLKINSKRDSPLCCVSWSGCGRVKNRLQISVSKCGGREERTVYHP